MSMSGWSSWFSGGVPSTSVTVVLWYAKDDGGSICFSHHTAVIVPGTRVPTSLPIPRVLYTQEAVGVRVVTFAHQYHGGLKPLCKGVATYVLPAWHKPCVLFARKNVARSSCSQPPPLNQVSMTTASQWRYLPSRSL